MPIAKPVTMLAPARFRFLNREGTCATLRDWNDDSREALWNYNLHYFDDLAGEGASSRAEWHATLIRRWIAENPAPHGVGWHPYPVSLRIVNWIKWSLAGLDGGVPDFDESLATQADWLSQRVEHHLLGNHILANAKGLVAAGLFFSGAAADRWLRAGLEILARELPEQLLPDGAHFERSPMYHAIVLEDVLDLVNMARAYSGAVPASVIDSWRQAASRMEGWNIAMAHPDGEIAFFNDAAFGIAPTPAELSQYARRLGVEAADAGAPGASGYHRAERGTATLLVDVAPLGPDYQPAHAHADTLSFELSVRSSRILVNSGTSTYEAGPQRAQERSTAAHNTVEIDDSDSSEVWASFRVARRARPRDLSIRDEARAFEISASHDGYRWLEGAPRHHREWRLTERQLEVRDRVVGPFTRAVARFYLHPDVAVGPNDVLTAPGGTTLRWRVLGASAEVRRSRWFPEFGLARDSHCIEVPFGPGASPTFELEW